MRKLLAIVALGTILISSSAHALVIGQMRPASTLGMGSLNLMTGVGIFDNARHVFGTVRYGLAAPLDITASFAIADLEGADDPAFVINSDLQYQFMRSELGWALDMAGGIVFEYYAADFGNTDYSVWSLGFNYVLSRPVKLDNGFAFTPYGRLNLRSDNWSQEFKLRLLDQPLKADDNEFNIGFNFGTVFPMSSKFSLVGELQIDDEVGFLAGINFFMW